MHADCHLKVHHIMLQCPLLAHLCTSDLIVVVVDLPFLRVAVEGCDNPIIQSSPARRPFHMDSRVTTLSGDIHMSSMLLEVYKCTVE